MIGDFPIMVVTHILCILAKNVIQCTVARVHVLPYHIIFYTGEIGLSHNQLRFAGVPQQNLWPKRLICAFAFDAGFILV